MDQEIKRAIKSVSNYNSRVKKGDPSDCWPWAGNKRCRVKGFKPITPQRVAWCIAKGAVSLPPGMDVSPTCGDAECCNPAHLRLVQAKPALKRGHDMRPITVDIRADQLVELQRLEKFRTRSRSYLVREALDTAFRLAEGSEGRVPPVAVSENPTET